MKSDEPKRFPVREKNGKWEVYISPDLDEARWEACDSESEARIISNAPVLNFRFHSHSDIADEPFADELEKTAHVFEKHKMNSGARGFLLSAQMIRERLAV